MSEQEIEDQKKIDESYKILYTTFMIIGVLFFFWLLMVIFTDAPKEIEEVMEEEEK